ncbi:hypothetical protein ACFFJN_04505 [Erwinia mallotivora]|uniref:hypothetical protein n=1 Tax=Erwinia mallotivora TaxID=69222 RepID=UPI0035E99FE5
MFRFAVACCLLSFTSYATATVECGPFTIDTPQSGVFLVNHAKATKVKTTWSGKPGDTDNVRYHWIVKNTRAPGKLAMENRYQQGVATLHVEVVPTPSQPVRISGDYDCKAMN